MDRAPLDVSASEWMGIASNTDGAIHSHVHQLDYATSGILLYGRTKKACAEAQVLGFRV